MKANEYPSQQLLLGWFDYNPDTGVLIRKKRSDGSFASKRAESVFNTRYADKVVNSMHEGYVTVSINGQRYYAHRLIWIMVHGAIPCDTYIDHINGVKDDNRLCNLRTATTAQNVSNMGILKRNTSGYKGASWYAPSGKWAAKIRVKGRLLHLGYHKTVEEAHEAYCKAAALHFGEFARTK
ncbi:MAG: HNH endonuclease [Desulfurellales bacterium]|nr:MAG: HNH endonuclease [Desulfurellales bacterium]